MAFFLVSGLFFFGLPFSRSGSLSVAGNIFDNLSSIAPRTYFLFAEFSHFLSVVFFHSTLHHPTLWSCKRALRWCSRCDCCVWMWREKSAQTNAATICKKLREDYFVFIHFSFIRLLATTARCCVLCAVDAPEESIGKKWCREWNALHCYCTLQWKVD